MKKPIKWALTAGAVLMVLAMGAMVLIPRFVDVQTYKPRLEQLVSEQTGRAFTMGDDIKLSVFPWVGLELTDLSLGNPPGFEAREMISVKRFEVRLKVMPLIFRRIEVDRFVVDTPLFFLEKNREGQGNWENLGPGKQTGKTEPPDPAGVTGEPDPGQQDPGKQDKAPGLPIESLMVGNFSIKNGFVAYEDKGSGLKKEIKDFNLTLKDISFDKPVAIKLAARMEGQPIALEGTAGPFGREPGRQDIALDLKLSGLDLLNLTLKGKIMEALADWKIDMDLEAAPFSPRKLFSDLGLPFPVQTADPTVLDKVGLKGKITGTRAKISFSDSTLILDDTILKFLADIKTFDLPDIRFDLSLDTLDLDRYLPPAPSKTEGSGPAEQSDPGSEAPAAGPGKKTEYGPLRTLVLDGRVQAGSLTVAKVQIQDFSAQVKGKEGVFDLDPLTLNLYQGSVASKVRLDLRQSEPETQMSLEAIGIQAGPLLKDALEKDIIEGSLTAEMSLNMTGTRLDSVKKSLGGKGDLNFTDGAIVGIDIANMVRNVTSGLGLDEKPAEKPRTDFAQLEIPFSAHKGKVNIPGATLMSPLLRLEAAGNTDLVRETLDFRVEPKVVATLKGQGGSLDRSGLMVPLLVTGTFASPKVQPDLQAIINKEVLDLENIKQLLEPKSSSETGEESFEEKAKGLLRSFLPGITN